MKSLIKKRQGNKLIMPDGWSERLDNKICPPCGGKNHRSYRCCSVQCTVDFWKKAWWSNDIKGKVFSRDNYTCVKCGRGINDYMDWQERYFKWSKEVRESGKHKACYDFYSKSESLYQVETGDQKPELVRLEDDHILPIALGGDEYDLNNRQTLCNKCHRRKTSREARLFAQARKGIDVSKQSFLNFK